MKLKIGDIVEFKKYEDMTYDEISHIDRDFFPKSGKVSEIKNDGFFTIKYSGYVFHPESVARVISDVDNIDINSLNPGDEVLVKATVKKVFNGFIQIEPSVGRTGVIDILKRKEPERFILKEVYYNMYTGEGQGLVSDKNKAKVYTSRDAANHDAINMLLVEWEVLPYDD